MMDNMERAVGIFAIFSGRAYIFLKSLEILEKRIERAREKRLANDKRKDLAPDQEA